MVSFLEIIVLFLCIGIIFLLLSLTSYSCRMNVSGEKKETPARYGIDYVIVSVHNYFSPPPLLPATVYQDNYEYKKQYTMSELRHRTQGGAYSPHLPVNEKEKIV